MTLAATAPAADFPATAAEPHRQFLTLLGLLLGVTIAPLITHRFAARDAAEAYHLILEHPEQSLGVVLDWTQA